MKKCKWCNSEIENDATTCPYCKAVVDKNAATSTKDYIKEYLNNHKDNVSYNNYVSQTTKKKRIINSIANTLCVIGKIIIALGVTSSIIILITTEFESFFVFITTLFVSLVSGFTFLGFAEIIQLLQDIKDKME